MPRDRRGRIALTVLCGTLALVLAYTGPGAARPARSAPVPTRAPAAYRIAVGGDAVSGGFGAAAPRYDYVARVSAWLRAHGKRLTETVDAKGGVVVSYWIDAGIPEKLDAAVIELGTNDVRRGTPPAQFASEYHTLTSRILATNPRTRILGLSVWSHPHRAGPDAVINARIRSVCPGTYVDITGLRRRPHVRAFDGFHPNDKGYRLIAQAVEANLKAG